MPEEGITSHHPANDPAPRGSPPKVDSAPPSDAEALRGEQDVALERRNFETLLESHLMGLGSTQMAGDTPAWWTAIPRPIRRRFKRENVLETFVRLIPKLRSANDAALYHEA